LTAQQPENNIVRVALQALAAVLGGTQSLHTNSLDEALALPGESAARIALRTQQILAHESGVANTVDPLGGCYAIEAMTDQIEAEAHEYIRRIDALGGAVRAIEIGYIQREIQESAYRFQRSVETGRSVIVGLNKFAASESVPYDLMTVDEAVAERQRCFLKELRQTRDKNAAGKALDRLKQAASGRDNVMPFILDAVESRTTIGEIADSLRAVFGEYRETAVV
jgi:methylmalonyl-CoA mutase N-terminal domain/subunit